MRLMALGDFASPRRGGLTRGSASQLFTGQLVWLHIVYIPQPTPVAQFIRPFHCGKNVSKNETATEATLRGRVRHEKVEVSRQ